MLKALSSIFVVFSLCGAQTIAVVGNSVTLLSSYPEMTDSILDGNYRVWKIASSGSTILRDELFPYWLDSFYTDYLSLIDTFSTTGAKIMLCLPTPVWENHYFIGPERLADTIIPQIRAVAQAKSLPLIDLYTPLIDKSNWFPDSCHMNEQASLVVALILADAIRQVSSSKMAFHKTEPPLADTRQPFNLAGQIVTQLPGISVGHGRKRIGNELRPERVLRDTAH
jgi:hypothetical protein